jgi:hypothetical protein
MDKLTFWGWTAFAVGTSFLLSYLSRTKMFKESTAQNQQAVDVGAAVIGVALAFVLWQMVS